jgi:hypothetical protein
MNTYDTLTLWYDLFSRELNRWMDKIHKMERPKVDDVYKAFKFSTEFADAGIKEFEVRQEALVGVDDALPEDSI